jgi:glycosyltransferase involved in cell wall biosynthesis
MKIYAPNISEQQIGGGWTFLSNFTKAMKGQAEFVDSWLEADIFLVTSVTMIDKSEVHMASKAGKKIVLRVDNMPRKSRNQRMSPHERMREFAQMSAAVIYQSQWARSWIGQSIGYLDKSHVILNGVNTNIFKPIKKEGKGYRVFLIVQYNRDENKRMPEAFDMFTAEYLKHMHDVLWIVGRFSSEIVNSGFDFWRNEKFEYKNIMETPYQMASIMQQADILLYPSYSDALPNTVIEAKACGMEVWHHGHAGVGEAASIADPSLDRMGKEYLDLFNSL